ncbi:PP2C family protein-serine/threonine phosphatase [Actinomadura rudentiformis]|uniref:PPM-type phosphatase domain-containing protein n=1 Tax=Actinomadura rudentiformis TaxID=359158 RepID=A0A6H9Z0S7_9ACTN|nr:hypothetical protein [Actinomadura rudentiformis]KAB2348046.1 hypothetical protein F8566_19470 [Actinomadura rudentiformis]
MGVIVAVGSQIGRASQVNQDAVYAGPQLQVVAAGRGSGGDIAAAEVVEAMARQVIRPSEDALNRAAATLWEERFRPRSPIMELALSAIDQAHERLGRLKQHDQRCTDATVWVTAIHWSGHELALTHVGLCRAYLIRDGEIYQITHDFTLPRALPAPRFLDGTAAPDPDQSLRESRPGDRYILCTRGFAPSIHDGPDLRIIKEGASPADIVNRLMQAVQANPAADDASCVVIDVMATETTVEPVTAGALARLPRSCE